MKEPMIFRFILHVMGDVLAITLDAIDEAHALRRLGEITSASNCLSVTDVEKVYKVKPGDAAYNNLYKMLFESYEGIYLGYSFQHCGTL